MTWVIHDPVVWCLAPALFLLNWEGQVDLTESTYQAAMNIFLVNKARWMRREYRLKEILTVLNRAGISVIPLKGAILHSMLYKDCGLRSMTDIDIMVPPDALLSTARLLVQQGLRFLRASGIENLAQLEMLPAKY